MVQENKNPFIDEEAPEHDTLFEEKTEEDKGVLAEIDFDLRQTGRWLLKVIGGPNNGAEFSMQTGTAYLIGTDPTACDVVFHDTSVSRQHARLTVSDDNTLAIEDLRSRNGTHVDGEPISGRVPLEPNVLVSMGTTSFIVFDREGDMQTIISPLLPSIVKVLQKGKEGEDEEAVKAREKEAAAQVAKAVEEGERKLREEKKKKSFGAFAIIGIIAATFLVVGIGTMTLFVSEPVQMKKVVDYDAELKKAIEPFPSVKFSYNNNTGQLLLVGHVLTLSDKNLLLYNLQGLNFIKTWDTSGLVVDEFVARETNSILARDPKWKGISLHSPTAGHFALSGSLKTRKQAEELSDYITANFPYLDLLENRVIVEEVVLSTVDVDLDNAGLKNLIVQLNNGELSISGGLAKEQVATLNRLVKQFKEIPGVRSVKTFINEVAPELTMVNISNKYKVTGFSHQAGGNMTVVINGRILSRGDILDGMTITTIKPTVVFLEKGGTKYRIDYNQQ